MVQDLGILKLHYFQQTSILGQRFHTFKTQSEFSGVKKQNRILLPKVDMKPPSGWENALLWHGNSFVEEIVTKGEDKNEWRQESSRSKTVQPKILSDIESGKGKCESSPAIRNWTGYLAVALSQIPCADRW